MDELATLIATKIGPFLKDVADIRKLKASVNITSVGIEEALLEYDVTVVKIALQGSLRTKLTWSSIIAQLVPKLVDPIKDIFNKVKPTSRNEPVSKKKKKK